MSYTRRSTVEAYDNVSVANASVLEKIAVAQTAPVDATADDVAVGSVWGEENIAPGVAPPEELLTP